MLPIITSLLLQAKRADIVEIFFLTEVNPLAKRRDVAAAPQTPQLGGGGPGQLWGPKLV